MYKQSTMAFAAFIMLLAFATLPAPSSAHPISRREYGTAEVAVPIISDIQGSAPAPTPATTTTNIILPRDHESLPSDLASSATDKETESPSGASSSSSPEETQSEESNQDDEHSGLHPNAIAGIAVGVFFGVLLLIAAFMWAFRVGWEKGQMQKEEEKEREMAEAKLQEPPAAATTPQQSWQLVDDCITTRPPSALTINTTGNSCWDGGSWDCCDEHAENHRILGERYSFRPEMGVYEITDLEADTPRESIGADSGLGMESLRKARGKEPERPNSPPANA